MSFTINLNSTDTSATGPADNFRVNFKPPLFFGSGKYECALVSANVWNSIANVSATEYNNARFTYEVAAITYDIDIPEGTYSIVDLNAAIFQGLVDDGNEGPPGTPSIELVPNFNTLKIEIVINDPAFSVDLSTSNFYKLLGFSDAQAAVPITVSTVGDNVANINNDINKLLITTTFLDNSGASYDGANTSNVLYSFVFSNPPGANEDITPAERLYIPMNNAKQISYVQMQIKDNLNRDVDFRGEPVSYLLHLREVK
jgi:hypothetical protein